MSNPLARMAFVCFSLGFMFPAASNASAQSMAVAQSAASICDGSAGTPVADLIGTPSPSLDLTTLEMDLIFLDAMIPHHEIIVQMASVVLERTERQELRNLATSIIEIRASEIAVMSGWRDEWYPDVPPLTEMQLVEAMNVKLAESPGVGGVAGLEEMGAEHLSEDLALICIAADDLDIAFIDVLIPHNQSAILLSGEAVNKSVHRETKNLADSLIATQQFEIDQLLAWREAWFQGTPIPDHRSEARMSPV